MRTARNEARVYYPMQDTPIFHGNFPQRFRTDDGCLKYIFELLSENLRCPKCGRTGSYYFHRHPSKLCYTCNCGRYHFFPLKETIFSHSFVPLSRWFYSLFLMSKKPAGVSTKELQRELNVAYATAWRMMQQIHSVKPSVAMWKRGGSVAFNVYVRNAIRGK